MTPVRIQRLRAKGWRMPENTVYVGRPTKWGNPFRVGEKNPYGTITADLRHSYAIYLGFAPQNDRLVTAVRAELAGKNLACWCPLTEHCHADVLLEIANGIMPLVKLHSSLRGRFDTLRDGAG